MVKGAILLRQQRKLEGWTQWEMANEIGWDGSFVSLVENGLRIPGRVYARRLERRFPWITVDTWDENPVANPWESGKKRSKKKQSLQAARRVSVG